MNTPETVMARVTPDANGCWIWTGPQNGMGYGLVKYQGKAWSVHRLTYTWHKGEIAPGLQIDHLCRNPICCNPDHLEMVTQQENMNRGLRNYGLRTVCRNGLHDLTLPNAIVERQGKRPGRTCRECLRISSAKWRANYGRKRY